jgi:hypothetical protein
MDSSTDWHGTILITTAFIDKVTACTNKLKWLIQNKQLRQRYEPIHVSKDRGASPREPGKAMLKVVKTSIIISITLLVVSESHRCAEGADMVASLSQQHRKPSSPHPSPSLVFLEQLGQESRACSCL